MQPARLAAGMVAPSKRVGAVGAKRKSNAIVQCWPFVSVVADRDWTSACGAVTILTGTARHGQQPTSERSPKDETSHP